MTAAADAAALPTPATAAAPRASLGGGLASWAWWVGAWAREGTDLGDVTWELHP